MNAAAPWATGPEGSAGAPAHVEIRDLSKVYATTGRPVRALDQVSLSAERGTFISIIGPSGCGKSTLLMMVAGLLPSSSGAVLIDGQEVKRPITDVGIVFQSPVLLDWRSTLKNVLIQAEARGLEKTVSEARARDLLASVGLAGFEDRYPFELSGGMQQRVAICRALLHDPTLLLMDEPFGALDAFTRDQMMLDLQRLWLRRQKTVLFITHSVPEAVFLSDYVVVMTPRPGRIDRVLKIDLPRLRAIGVRESREFAGYVKTLFDVFLAFGVIKDSALPE